MTEAQQEAPIVAEAPAIVDPDDHQQAAPRDLNEVEALAKEMGWNPDFKGEKARTASDWIRSTGANNRNMKRDMADMRASVDRIAAAADKQVKREISERSAEIQARFDAAVKTQDTAAAARAANEMTELRQESAPSSTAEDDFARDNAWYGKDKEATAYAVAMSNVEAQNGNTSPATQLKAVAEAVKKRFPELFDGATTTKPPAALGDPGSRVIAKPRAKGFADMPDMARAAADRFFAAAEQRGTAKDRKAFDAQYAKDYWSEQSA